MERVFTVEFGPSRSKRFGKAVAEARRGARECSEVEPGRYRATFVLGEDSAAYAALASFLARVRHWRATCGCEVACFVVKDLCRPECVVSVKDNQRAPHR